MMLQFQSRNLGTLAPAAFLAAPFPDIELLIPASLAGLGGTLAEYIARMEGYQVAGSIAQRNNNPGNLRSGAGQVGTASGFAVFSTPEAGWAALDRQIALDAGRGLTLEQFIYKYAPPSENDSAGYLRFVASSLRVSPETPLASLTSDSGDTIPLPDPSESLYEEETGEYRQESEASGIPTGLWIAGATTLLALALTR